MKNVIFASLLVAMPLAGCSKPDFATAHDAMEISPAQKAFYMRATKKALAKNDQLTYVYTQSTKGRFDCIGQAVGEGVIYEIIDSPNIRYTALAVNYVNSKTGKVQRIYFVPSTITVLDKLPDAIVDTACPADIDPTKIG